MACIVFAVELPRYVFLVADMFFFLSHFANLSPPALAYKRGNLSIYCMPNKFMYLVKY